MSATDIAALKVIAAALLYIIIAFSVDLVVRKNAAKERQLQIGDIMFKKISWVLACNGNTRFQINCEKMSGGEYLFWIHWTSPNDIDYLPLRVSIDCRGGRAPINVQSYQSLKTDDQNENGYGRDDGSVDEAEVLKAIADAKSNLLGFITSVARERKKVS